MRRALVLGLLLAACNGGEPTDPPEPPPVGEAAPLSDAELDIMGRALAAMQSRDYTAVEGVLAPLLARVPPPADALYVAGSAAYELQRYEDAVRHLAAAVAAKPEFLSTSSALGFAHHKLGQFAQAAAAFQAIVDELPEAYKAHYGLGLVALDEGRLADARRHLERALAIKGDYLKARFHMARLLHEEKRLEEARDALAALVDAWPSHEEALYRYARVLSELGDEAGAERVMARHQEVYATKERIGGLVAQQRAGQDSPALRAQIVTLWLQLGEWNEAHAACRAAVVAYPDDATLTDLLQRVIAMR